MLCPFPRRCLAATLTLQAGHPQWTPTLHVHRGSTPSSRRRTGAGTGAGVAEEEGTSGEAEVAKGKGLARFGVDWELLSWLLV